MGSRWIHGVAYSVAMFIFLMLIQGWPFRPLPDNWVFAIPFSVLMGIVLARKRRLKTSKIVKIGTTPNK